MLLRIFLLTEYAPAHYYSAMQKYTLGQRLSMLRDKAHLSQSELAKESGVDQGLISRIERGEICRPGFLTVGKLCTALGVSLDDLLNCDSEPRVSARK